MNEKLWHRSTVLGQEQMPWKWNKKFSFYLTHPSSPPGNPGWRKILCVKVIRKDVSIDPWTFLSNHWAYDVIPVFSQCPIILPLPQTPGDQKIEPPEKLCLKFTSNSPSTEDKQNKCLCLLHCHVLLIRNTSDIVQLPHSQPPPYLIDPGILKFWSICH